MEWSWEGNLLANMIAEAAEVGTFRPGTVQSACTCCFKDFEATRCLRLLSLAGFVLVRAFILTNRSRITTHRSLTNTSGF
jgi:hypothetical protein